MKNFDEIWPWFGPVMEEMKYEGMCFFEGYIPSIAERALLSPLSELEGRAKYCNCIMSTWSNETTELDWNKVYDLAEYVDFFSSGRILRLHFDYEVRSGGTNLSQKLMFDKDDRATSLEIICYREPILSSPNPRQAVADAVSEICNLKRLFAGDALFLGPDTLDYPKSATDNPKEWLRIE